MSMTIKIKYRKELDNVTERKIIKLKGALIADKFTEIIHFEEDGSDSYISYFNVDVLLREEAVAFVKSYLREEMLEDQITIIP